MLAAFNAIVSKDFFVQFSQCLIKAQDHTKKRFRTLRMSYLKIIMSRVRF